MDRDEQERAAFWRQTEESLGEEILDYTMGECWGCAGGKDVLYGLFFLTRTTLHFRHFIQTNWATSLVQSSRVTGSRPADQEVSFSADLTSAVLVMPSAIGWFARLFGSGRFPAYTIEQSGVAVIRFSLHFRERAFLSVLRDRVQMVDEP